MCAVSCVLCVDWCLVCVAKWCDCLMCVVGRLLYMMCCLLRVDRCSLCAACCVVFEMRRCVPVVCCLLLLVTASCVWHVVVCRVLLSVGV